MVMIAAVDVGTSSVRCVVYDQLLRELSSDRESVIVLRPKIGFAEIEPEGLVQSVCDVIRGAMNKLDKNVDEITCLSLSTQRGSFITWDHATGKVYHNVVCWNDLRASNLVIEWNRSWKLSCASWLCGLLHKITGNDRYLAASILRMMNEQVTLRLLWCMENVSELREGMQRGVARFGTLDTFLIYRLTSSRLHVTESSSAAATGFFDPYTMQWSSYARWLFGVAPEQMLPVVLPSGGQFGSTEPSSPLHAVVPIAAVAGDQGCSALGSGCWRQGDVCVTLGTGAFIDIITGSRPHTSILGLYPQVAWHLDSELCYTAEGGAGDAAGCVLWGEQVGLYEHVAHSSDLADSVNDSDGVYFVPAFSGLGAPINDYHAASGFIGITRQTTRAHLTHALLASICYRVAQLYFCSQKELKISDPVRETGERTEEVRVCVTGGVAGCDFVCQLIAHLLDVPVTRPKQVESTALGAAVLAGLVSRVWTDKRHVSVLLQEDNTIFKPDPQKVIISRRQMETWKNAIGRFVDWYN